MVSTWKYFARWFLFLGKYSLPSVVFVCWWCSLSIQYHWPLKQQHSFLVVGWLVVMPFLLMLLDFFLLLFLLFFFENLRLCVVVLLHLFVLLLLTPFLHLRDFLSMWFYYDDYQQDSAGQVVSGIELSSVRPSVALRRYLSYWESVCVLIYYERRNKVNIIHKEQAVLANEIL